MTVKSLKLSFFGAQWAIRFSTTLTHYLKSDKLQAKPAREPAAATRAAKRQGLCCCSRPWPLGRAGPSIPGHEPPAGPLVPWTSAFRDAALSAGSSASRTGLLCWVLSPAPPPVLGPHSRVFLLCAVSSPRSPASAGWCLTTTEPEEDGVILTLTVYKGPG